MRVWRPATGFSMSLRHDDRHLPALLYIPPWHGRTVQRCPVFLASILCMLGPAELSPCVRPTRASANPNAVRVGVRGLLSG